MRLNPGFLTSLGKVEGKRERERGNKGKSGAKEGMVVEKEGEGISDVIVRHRCALEAVCSLNSEVPDVSHRGNSVEPSSEVQAFCDGQTSGSCPNGIMGSQVQDRSERGSILSV